MSDIKIVVGADVAQATAGLRTVQGELGKTAVASREAAVSFNRLGTSLGTIAAGGVVAGIALIGSALVELAQSFFEVSAAEKAFIKTQEEGIKAFTKAKSSVDQLTIQIDLAKKGFVDKDAVVKHYNETIGKTTGLVSSVEQAEAELVKKGPAFIQMMFLKAQATYAFNKAAELSVQSLLLNSQKAPKQLLDDLKKQFDEQIKAYGKIAREAEQLANLIASENGLNIFSNNKEVKVKEIKVKPKKLTIEKPEQIEIKDIKTRDDNSLDDLVENIKRNFQDRLNKNKTPVLVDIKFLPQDDEAILKGLRALIDKAKLEEFQEEATAAIDATLLNIAQDIASSAADAIGAAIAGDKNALPDLFGNIIKGIGTQIKDLGKFLVKAGIEMIAAKKSVKALGITPQAAIVAGIGLQILGAVLAAQFNKKAQGFASGTTALGAGTFANINERGQERVFLPRGSSVQPANEVNAYGRDGIVLQPSIHYDADGFRIMLQRADQRANRNN